MDTTDYSALTLGHFLIGRFLLALPEPELTEIPTKRSTRWNFIQLQQGFWRIIYVHYRTGLSGGVY